MKKKFVKKNKFLLNLKNHKPKDRVCERDNRRVVSLTKPTNAKFETINWFVVIVILNCGVVKTCICETITKVSMSSQKLHK